MKEYDVIVVVPDPAVCRSHPQCPIGQENCVD